jgi:hypothetical protein
MVSPSGGKTAFPPNHIFGTFGQNLNQFSTPAARHRIDPDRHGSHTRPKGMLDGNRTGV